MTSSLLLPSSQALGEDKIPSAPDVNAVGTLIHLQTWSNTWSEEVHAMIDDAMHLLAPATL